MRPIRVFPVVVLTAALLASAGCALRGALPAPGAPPDGPTSTGAVSQTSSSSTGAEAGSGAAGGAASEATTTYAVVTGVIDGQTVRLDDGRLVCYIGVDAPAPGEKGHEVAKACNRGLVEGKQVKLVRDNSQRDSRGRLLRYVYVGGLHINWWLAYKGLVRVAVAPPDVQRAKELKSAQAIAKSDGLGLWAKPEEPEPAASSDGWDMGGFSSSLYGAYFSGFWGDAGKKVFHKTECTLVGRIPIADFVYLLSREEAQGQGYEPCSTCNP